MRKRGAASRLAALAVFAGGLGRLADPTTRPLIERALADPDFMVRDFAARALAALPTAP
jgi:HEAT repeat protein